MRIFHSNHPLWRYYLASLDDMEYECIPIIMPAGPIYSRLSTVFSYCGYKNPIAQSLYKQHITTYSGSTLVLDCHNPTILYRIANSQVNKSKLFLWFWNPIKSALRHYNVHSTIKTIKELGFKIFTFDVNDAKEYGLFLKNQFGISYNYKGENNTQVYFCGKDKGREHEIAAIAEILSSLSIDNHIIIPKRSIENISMEENVNNMLSSRCLLDIPQNGQFGLTLRPIEALLNNKKLITTNVDIVRYDFYNPNNIFIWGRDRIEDLKEFISNPIEPVPDIIKNKYTFEHWLKSWEE